MSLSVAPYIDPNVEHVGVSKLRTLNASNLREIQKTWVIQDNDKPLAVLLAYEQYLAIQELIDSIRETVEILADSEEAVALTRAWRDMEAGKTKTIGEIRSKISKKRRA